MRGEAGQSYDGTPSLPKRRKENDAPRLKQKVAGVLGRGRRTEEVAE